MDSKAVVGYLVGYDSDERCRIYVPEKCDVVLSRDIVFQEKIFDCDEQVSLPLKEELQIEKEKDESNITDKIQSSDKPESSKSSLEDEEDDAVYCYSYFNYYKNVC